MEWHDLSFSQLGNIQLLKILELRAEVFNKEQDSAYPDPDDQDQSARHVFATDGGHLSAYARYFAEDGKATFGRVVVSPDYRKQGMGRELIRHVLQGIKEHDGDREILIHAQYYIRHFYAEFGFQEHGQTFMEADRKHIMMTHSPLR